MNFRIVHAGDSALVVEFEERIDALVNACAVGVAESIQAARLPGVRDVTSAYRAVTVYLDPLRTDLDGLTRRLEQAASQPPPKLVRAASPLCIPVCYGGAFGPDLGGVAAYAGLSEAEVIARHWAPVYRVFMMGFVPGFTYLGPVDSQIAAPRRATPRVRVPAGSIGIAGLQTGIYPSETPGGWQLIGRTPVKTFDLARSAPFLLKAGDSVQFYPVEEREISRLQDERTTERQSPVEPSGSPADLHSPDFIRVLRPGLQTTIQDRGRWGLQSRGVPTAGPMDPCSHRIANALVGSDPDVASLEITLVGPEIEFEDERIVAVAGAEFALTVDGRSQAMNTAFVVPSGSCLRFGARSRGVRAYLAIAGGIAVDPVLGSRSTHLASRMGGLNGRALAAGDRLPLGRRRGNPRRMIDDGDLFTLPSPGLDTRICVIPGPERERFDDDALRTLQSAPYSIRIESNRMGFRLQGPLVGHAGSAGIISDATPLGTLQVPASGEPVLLMADRQTSGGYPRIATVISADIGRAGQLAPGDQVSFEVCTLHDALTALIRQERALMAIEASS